MNSETAYFPLKSKVPWLSFNVPAPVVATLDIIEPLVVTTAAF